MQSWTPAFPEPEAALYTQSPWAARNLGRDPEWRTPGSEPWGKPTRDSA